MRSTGVRDPLMSDDIIFYADSNKQKECSVWDIILSREEGGNQSTADLPTQHAVDIAANRNAR